jgi:Holliday junction resolvase RusA-like endonuclease
MGTVQFMIPVNPRPWSRTRMNKWGKRFNTAEHEAAMDAMKTYFILGMRSKNVFKDPIEVELIFHVQRAKNPAYHCRDYPARTPDLSNYIKLAEDAGNGIVWRDDAIIVKLVAEKRYAKESPCIEVIVKPLLEKN